MVPKNENSTKMGIYQDTAELQNRELQRLAILNKYEAYIMKIIAQNQIRYRLYTLLNLAIVSQFMSTSLQIVMHALLNHLHLFCCEVYFNCNNETNKEEYTRRTKKEDYCYEERRMKNIYATNLG